MSEASATSSASNRGESARRSRLPVLLAIGGALIVGGYLYRHFFYDRPTGSGPAGPSVPREAFSQVWSNRPIVLVGLGDSITAGYGASARHSYFDRLIADPPNEFEGMRGIHLRRVLPRLEARNLALSGSTSLEHLDILLPKLESQDEQAFGIVVLTTGGNDIIHNYGRTPPREGAMYGADWKQAQPWIANFKRRLSRILDEVETRFPGGCAVFLANIYDPTDDTGDAEHAGLPAWPDGLKVLAAYNDVLTQAAEQRSNVELIDLHGAFLGHGIHCLQPWHRHYSSVDPYYWYYDNLEDPNDRGYDAIRRLFLIKMAETLPQLLAGQAGDD